MKFHPCAEIFPLMQGAEFEALVSDIKANGLRQPIILYEEKILDGRNRWRACEKAGVEAKTKNWLGGDPLAYVISLNLTRRHLSESQRAMVGARIATLQHGGDRSKSPIGGLTQEQSAEKLNVGKKSVERARAVLDSGTPELIEAVERDEIAVSAAEKIAKQSPSKQRNLVSKIKAGARPQEAHRQERAEEAREASKLPATKYRVIYADPPWSYGNTQPDYHPEQRDHYAVMSLQAIAELPVQEMVERDAVLFLWVTSPILEDAFKIIHAWGFDYKASFIWDKIKHNMGHYNSVRHEFLLVCARGSCQPDERKLFDSVVSEERGEHSAKPETFRKIIDTIYPIGKRLELFRRGPAVKGWDAWGNESQA